MYQLSKQKMDELTKNILSQAKYYLEEADEFYPFGSVIDKDQNIKPVSIFLDKEYPDSSEVLNKLDEAIKDGIAKKDYLTLDIMRFMNQNSKLYIVTVYDSSELSQDPQVIEIYTQPT